MKENKIHMLESFKAATIMLNMDKSFIKDNLVLDSKKFIDDLKMAVEHYQKPFKPKSGGSPIFELEKNLDDLVNAANNFYFILSEDGKELFHQLLSQKLHVTPR